MTWKSWIGMTVCSHILCLGNTDYEAEIFAVISELNSWACAREIVLFQQCNIIGKIQIIFKWLGIGYQVMDLAMKYFSCLVRQPFPYLRFGRFVRRSACVAGGDSFDGGSPSLFSVVDYLGADVFPLFWKETLVAPWRNAIS